MDISKEGNICIFLHFRVLGVCIDCFSVMEQEEEKEEQEFGENNALHRFQLVPPCFSFENILFSRRAAFLWWFQFPERTGSTCC